MFQVQLEARLEELEALLQRQQQQHQQQQLQQHQQQQLQQQQQQQQQHQLQQQHQHQQRSRLQDTLPHEHEFDGTHTSHAIRSTLVTRHT